MPTDTFTTVGTHTWTAPSNQTVTLKVTGAGGGKGGQQAFYTPGNGGSGGYAEVDVSVSSGEQLTVYVPEGGINGDASGDTGGIGYNNGGDAYNTSGIDVPGGSGAGSGAVEDGSGSLILLVGGGGGGGASRRFGDTSSGAGGADGGTSPNKDGTVASEDGGGTGSTGGDGGIGAVGAGEPGGDGEDGDYSVSQGSLVTGSKGGGATESTGGTRSNGSVSIDYLPAPPATPSNSISYVANNQIKHSITADTSGGPIDNYDVQINRDGLGYTSPSGGPSSPSSDGTYSYGPNSDNSYDSQVGIDSSFKFRVRASNAGGDSSWTYSGTVYTEPIPPHNPSVSRPGANQFEISWETKTDIVDYTQIQYRIDTGSGYGGWQFLDNQFSGTSSFTWTTTSGSQSGDDVQEDARYQFRIKEVRPDNPSGTLNSEWVYADYGNENNVYFEDDFESNDLSAWDSNNLAGDTGVQSGTGPADLTIGGADEGTYYFYGGGEGSDDGTWLQKDLGDLSNETDVIVKCAFATASLDDPAEDFGISWYDGSSWQSLKHFGWEYNKQGWYEVSALVPPSYLSTNNRIRVGTTTSSGMYGGDHFAIDRVVVSDILHEYTKPSAPSQASLDTSTEGQITATWTLNAPSFFNDDVKWGEVGGGNNYNGGNGSYTATGLEDGEQYQFTPRSYKYQYRRGNSEDLWLTGASPTTAVTLLPAPSTPSATLTDDVAVDLEWTPADNSSDGGIDIERSTDGFTTIATVTTLSSDASSYTDSNIDYNTTYNYRVERTTDHATVTSGAVTQTAPTRLFRTTTLTGDGQIDTSRVGVSKARAATLQGGGEIEAFADFSEALGERLSGIYIDYDVELKAFVTEWYDETPIDERQDLMSLRFTSQVETPLRFAIESDTDGDGDPEHRSRWLEFTQGHVPRIYPSVPTDAVQYRVLMRGLRTQDVLRRIDTAFVFD